MTNTKENTQYMGITDYEAWVNSSEADTLAEMYMQASRSDNNADIDFDLNLPFIKQK